MSSYAIKIENCNSIEKAEITISEGALNIKYGPNGLGKSTIARAIVASVANNGTLQNLKPFKYRSLAGQHEPIVSGTENIGSVLVFDDSYVSQFVFQRDEVRRIQI
jgi:predicted ATP-binding protein involved in virulence